MWHDDKDPLHGDKHNHYYTYVQTYEPYAYAIHGTPLCMPTLGEVLCSLFY